MLKKIVLFCLILIVQVISANDHDASHKHHKAPGHKKIDGLKNSNFEEEKNESLAM